MLENSSKFSPSNMTQQHKQHFPELKLQNETPPEDDEVFQQRLFMKKKNYKDLAIVADNFYDSLYVYNNNIRLYE